jgi:hypothetical protein
MPKREGFMSGRFWRAILLRFGPLCRSGRSDGLNCEVNDAKEQGKAGDAEDDVGEKLHGADESGTTL